MSRISIQRLELLRENLEFFLHSVSGHEKSALIEETGSIWGDEYYALYEMNDEVFLFHLSRKSLSELFIFENVPAGLEYLAKTTGE
ncbi:MAG: hypothetical protein KDC45_06980 [Bacteroidetes bacterium]|nr:hypothetical protein [Bacteroidota bacterium]